jgi:hypothetical protein
MVLGVDDIAQGDGYAAECFVGRVDPRIRANPIVASTVRGHLQDRLALTPLDFLLTSRLFTVTDRRRLCHKCDFLLTDRSVI